MYKPILVCSVKYYGEEPNHYRGPRMLRINYCLGSSRVGTAKSLRHTLTYIQCSGALTLMNNN